jgi:hypothetical protein
VSGYYVLLTGSKNNAGDYLIKYRAKKLFAKIRPDRQIVDFNAWEPLDDQALEAVNGAKALIMLGGPALQERMYPRVYALRDNLSDIKVPLTTMGIGWHSKQGAWRNTYNFPLSEGTKRLLSKASDSGLPLSVRDFHTMNSLAFKGFKGALMTGCPAYYDLSYVDQPIVATVKVRKVAFSLGVSFLRSEKMNQSMRTIITGLKDYFSDAVLDVVFHHSVDEKSLHDSYGKRGDQYQRQLAFAEWLKQNGIGVVDISGSAEGLVEYYSDVDFHVGYRVHAHIFMNSISRMSVLIGEDGRGLATERVIGGNVIEGFWGINDKSYPKVFRKLGFAPDPYQPNPYVLEDVIKRYEYELQTDRHILRASRRQIDANYTVMQDFLLGLP